MKWFRYLISTLVLGAIAGGIAYATREQPLIVDSSSAYMTQIELIVSEEAKTRLEERFVISAPLAGATERILLDAGDRVTKGQVLARIQPTDIPLLNPKSRAEAHARLKAANARIDQVKAELEEAESQRAFAVKHNDRLQDSPDVTGDERDAAEVQVTIWSNRVTAAEFAVTVAKFEAEVARAALQRYQGDPASSDVLEIRSPVAGTVLNVMQKSAVVVQPGTALIELGIPDAIEIVAEMLTTQAARLAPGDKARFQDWGGPGSLRGRLRRIEPAAFTKVSALGVEEQRVNVIFDPSGDEETWHKLGDGYALEVDVILEHRENVVGIPLSAVFSGPQGEEKTWFVFVIDDESRARKRSVQIGLRGRALAEVQKGLKVEERVVLYPSDDLNDGMLVKARAGN